MNEENGYVYAALILRGKDLNPHSVIDVIGIQPTRSFSKGDVRKNNKEWPHGYWELNSKEYVTSADISSHINWLIKKLDGSKNEWLMFTGQEGIDAELSCFMIYSSNHEVINMDADLLSELSSLNISLEFDMYFEE